MTCSGGQGIATASAAGEYTLDPSGALTDPPDSRLLLTLDQDGYRTR